jgi:hypothetical protein
MTAAYAGIFSHTEQADVLPADKMIDSRLNFISVHHYVSHVRMISQTFTVSHSVLCHGTHLEIIQSILNITPIHKEHMTRSSNCRANLLNSSSRSNDSCYKLVKIRGLNFLVDKSMQNNLHQLTSGGLFSSIMYLPSSSINIYFVFP